MNKIWMKIAFAFHWNKEMIIEWRNSVINWCKPRYRNVVGDVLCRRMGGGERGRDVCIDNQWQNQRCSPKYPSFFLSLSLCVFSFVPRDFSLWIVLVSAYHGYVTIGVSVYPLWDAARFTASLSDARLGEVGCGNHWRAPGRGRWTLAICKNNLRRVHWGEVEWTPVGTTLYSTRPSLVSVRVAIFYIPRTISASLVFVRIWNQPRCLVGLVPPVSVHMIHVLFLSACLVLSAFSLPSLLSLF